MRFFDTHCHYNLPPFTTDDYGWKSFYEKAVAAGIEKTLNVGTNIETSSLAVEQAATIPDLYAAVGIHPGQVFENKDKTINTREYFEKELSKLESLIEKSSEQTIAMGEIGLDYYWLADIPEKKLAIEMQQWLLTKQLDLAEKHQLPICLHMRDKKDQAYSDLLNILKNRNLNNIILHAASGPIDYIQKIIDMGGYTSFAGNVTYPSSKHLRQIAKQIPANKILIETDVPYLTPEAVRGSINRPEFISYTAKYMQEELEFDLEQIYLNSLKAFNLSLVDSE